MIPLQLQLLGTLLLLAFLGWVLWLIRTERLTLRDSLVWLISTLVALTVTVFPQLLGLLSHALGIQVASNALFGAAVFYLSLNVLSVTITVSVNGSRVVRLSQECALLRAEVEKLRVAVGSPAQAPRELVR